MLGLKVVRNLVGHTLHSPLRHERGDEGPIADGDIIRSKVDGDARGEKRVAIGAGESVGEDVLEGCGEIDGGGPRSVAYWLAINQLLGGDGPGGGMPVWEVGTALVVKRFVDLSPGVLLMPIVLHGDAFSVQ
jgi:hypothetical protein